MATSLGYNFVFVFLLSVVVFRSSSQSIELNIKIAEELPVGTQVADLVADAELDDVSGGGHDELQFDVIPGSFYEYFAIGGDSGHLLVVNRVFDRDREVICYHRSVIVWWISGKRLVATFSLPTLSVRVCISYFFLAKIRVIV